MGGSSEDGHYRRLLNRSPAGLLVTTHEGRILDSNGAAAAALGYADPAELIGTDIKDRHASAEQRHELLRQIREQGEVRHSEFEMRTRDGETAYLLVSVKEEKHPEYDGEVLLTNWVDVTEQRKLREELEHRARHDDLTGLLNRRALFERSEQVLAMCRRENRRAAVAYLDLVGFKEVNEQVGHHGGDAILADVGSRIDDTLRDADLVSRLGGDEFVVVATLLQDEEDADQIGRRLMYAFDDPFQVAGRPLELQPAVGLAVFPEDGADIDTLLHRADRALWGPERRKAPGVRRYRDSTARTGVTPAWRVHKHLKRALQRGDELFQVYQPVVTAHGDDIVGVESLVRWRHPERGVVSPGTFIPEAEASGLIRQLDQAVCRETVRQAAAWNAKGLDIGWISMNISAQSLSDPSCLQWISRVLDGHPELHPGQIVVEITEHTAMQQVSRTDTLDRLKEDVGLSISIDDFGIGYSSLLYLRQFPADFLKIDMEFVKDVATNAADQKVVQGIVALGDAFNMELIAEGVETEPQEEWLRDARCQYLQGYRFGKPAPAREVTERLST